MGESYENGVTLLNGPTCSPHAHLCPNSLLPAWTVAPPGSSVLGILQARILDWVAISSSSGSSQHRDRTLCFGRQTLPLSQLGLTRWP